MKLEEIHPMAKLKFHSLTKNIEWVVIKEKALAVL